MRTPSPVLHCNQDWTVLVEEWNYRKIASLGSVQVRESSPVCDQHEYLNCIRVKCTSSFYQSMDSGQTGSTGGNATFCVEKGASK